MKIEPLISVKTFEAHSPIKMDIRDYAVFIPYINIANELYFNGGNIKEMNIPALVCYAVYQALPFHWASIINRSISIDDNTIDALDIAQLRKYVKDKADALLTELNKEDNHE